MSELKIPPGMTIEEITEFRRKERFAAARGWQFNEDLKHMLASLDPDHFRVFRLRWNLPPPPPPKEWDDIDTIMISMHAQRLVNRDTSPEEKLKSARYVTARGHPLPKGVSIVGDLLVGEVDAKIQSGHLPGATRP